MLYDIDSACVIQQYDIKQPGFGSRVNDSNLKNLEIATSLDLSKKWKIFICCL